MIIIIIIIIVNNKIIIGIFIIIVVVFVVRIIIISILQKLPFSKTKDQKVRNAANFLVHTLVVEL